MPRWLKFAVLILALLLLASIPLARQFESGSIEGVITNDHGPLSKAAVQARNVMSGAEFNAESAINGHYILENLEPGRYSLWVRAQGHDSVWIPRIVVERGETAHKDIHLERSHSVPTGI